MTWIALVGPEVEENLSLRYLASSLHAAGFGAAIMPFNQATDLPAVVSALLDTPEPPSAIAVSLAFQWRAQDMLALIVELRQRGYPGHITAGGHFGAFTYRELLTDFAELDSVCLHEAEEVLVELARALQHGDPVNAIAGLAVRGDGAAGFAVVHRPAPDLDTLPWPDRQGSPPTCLGHGFAPLVGSRGCYARCAFCCIAAWHRQAAGTKPLRLRPVDDVADEMAWLQQERGVDVFLFHDDTFFLPNAEVSLRRINDLADALEARSMQPFGTVVKARPTDVQHDLFRAMRDRLGLVRVFAGIETDADQGLSTLARRATHADNHRAMAVLRDLRIYPCFNLLIFDPDTTVESLQVNLAFMERYPTTPFNFGRVELYAGTPLLARMQAEERCRGNYLGWDYRLANDEVQQIFLLTLACFHGRNFATGAVANRLMGTRFDVEMARRFHPEVYRDEWLVRAEDLSRQLVTSSVLGLREIIAFVQHEGPRAATDDLVAALRTRVDALDEALGLAADELEEQIQAAVGRRCQHTLTLTPGTWIGRPSTDAYPSWTMDPGADPARSSG